MHTHLKKYTFKMGKISTNSTRQKANQHANPLYAELTSDGTKIRTKQTKKQEKINRGDRDEEFIEPSMSKKILSLARAQQNEIEEEENALSKRDGKNITEKYRFQLPQNSDEEQSDDEDDEETQFESMEGFDDEIEGDFGSEQELVDNEDAKLFEKYLESQNRPRDGFDGTKSFNLADKILAQMEKNKIDIGINETEDEGGHAKGEGVMLPPKVIAAYTQIGEVLSTYTHGKLPKLFKITPSLNNWEDVLYVTNPEAWSPVAVYEATRLFVSRLTASEAEKFISMILLERFRDDIANDEELHRLNYHIYRALKKSLYKPSAFFKGFLFPLAEIGCTSREAKIAGSVLSKISIPALHSSVALSHLLTLDYNPAIMIFIYVLIEKKYALPYQTIDDLVFYFMKFRNIPGTAGAEMDIDQDEKDNQTIKFNGRDVKLTKGWYRAFLAFAQIYKNDITDDQRDFLLETIRQRFHPGFGPEIRRELLAGKPREYKGQKEQEMVDVF